MKYGYYLRTVYSYPEIRDFDPNKSEYFIRETRFRKGLQDYTVDDITKEELIQYIMQGYKSSISYKKINF